MVPGGESTVSVTNSPAALARSCLHGVCKWLLRYLYPAGFLTAALCRAGTILGCLYGCIALSLGVGGIFSHRDDPHRWACLHHTFAAVSLVLLFASSILWMLCALNCLVPDEIWELLGLAGLTYSNGSHQHTLTCGSPLYILPEGLALGTSLGGVWLGGHLLKTPRPAEATGFASLRGWPRRIVLGLLLVSLACIDSNLFGLTYYASALTCFVSLGLRDKVCQRCWLMSATMFLRAFLITVICCHVLAVLVASLPAALPDDLKTALGVGGVRERIQCLTAFMLLELLVWSKGPPRQGQRGVRGDPAVVGLLDLEAATVRPESGVARRAATLTQTEDTARIAAAVEMSESLGVSGVSDTASTCGVLELEEREERAQQSSSPPRLRRARSSVAPSSRAASSTRPARQRRPTSRPSRPGGPRTSQPGGRVSRLGQAWDNCQRVVPHVQELSMNWIGLAARTTLPVLSMLVWACTSPSLLTLPLLLGALVLVHLASAPPWLPLFIALVYEVLCGLVLYSYALDCDVWNVVTWTNSTWPKRVGLECSSTPPAASASIAVQAFAIACLFIAVRCAAHRTVGVAGNDSELAVLELHRERHSGNKVASCLFKIAIVFQEAWKWTVVLMRLVIFFGIYLISVSEQYTSFTIIGLGYVFCSMILAAGGYCAKEERAGWDGLYGLGITWRGVLVYSECVTCLIFAWQVANLTDEEAQRWRFIGLRKSTSDAETFGLLLPHLVVALLASVQLQVFRTGFPSQPEVLKNRKSLLGRLFRTFGMYSQMILMFFFVVRLPGKASEPSLFSLLTLVLFALVVAAKQFGWSSKAECRILIVITLVAAALQLPGYILQVQGTKNWLREHFVPDWALARCRMVMGWQPFPADNQSFGSLLVLVLHSTILHRLASRCEGAKWEDIALYTRMYPSSLHLAILTRCSLMLLMYVAWFLTNSEDVLSRGQLLVLLGLLWTGRGWRFGGAWLSITSLIQLLVQYVYRYKDKSPFNDWNISPDLMEWLLHPEEEKAGLSEIILLLCSIVQGQVHKAAADMALSMVASGVNPQAPPSTSINVNSATTSSGAAAAASSTAFSPLPAAGAEESAGGAASASEAAEAGVASTGIPEASRQPSADAGPGVPLLQARPRPTGSSMRSTTSRQQLPGGPLRLTPGLAKGVMFFNNYGAHVSASLLVSLLVYSRTLWSIIHLSLCLVFVLSGTSARALTVSRTSKWSVVMSTLVLISLLYVAAMQTWLPKNVAPRLSARTIGNTWICDYWSVYRTTGCDDICPTQRERCGEAWLAWTRSTDTLQEAYISFTVFFLICLIHSISIDKEVQQAVQIALQEEGAEDEAGDHKDEGHPEEAGKDADAAPAHPSSTSTKAHEDEIHFRALVTKVLNFTVWIGLLGILLARTTSDAISSGYLVVLFQHAMCVQAGAAIPAAFEERLRRLRHIRTYNILAMIIIICYQMPDTPCAFDLQVYNDQNLTAGTTWFMTSDQCDSLQEQSPQGDNKRAWGGVLLESLGFFRMQMGLVWSGSAFWMCWIFMASMAEINAHLRWEQSLREYFQSIRAYTDGKQQSFKTRLFLWRRVELRQTDNKQQALRLKLRNLIEYISQLKDVWANRARPLSQEEERQRLETTRILDICLATGASDEEVQEFMTEFKATEEHLQAHAGVSAEENAEQTTSDARKKLDELIIQRLQIASELELNKISSAEADKAVEALLHQANEVHRVFGCHGVDGEEEVSAGDVDAAANSPHKSSQSGAASPAGEQQTPKQRETASPAATGASAASAASAAAAAVAPVAGGAAARAAAAALPYQREEAAAASADAAVDEHREASGNEDDDDEAGLAAALAAKKDGEEEESPVEKAEPSAPEQASQLARGCGAMLHRACKSILEALIDDTLFTKAEDTTLQDHKDGNSLIYLLFKALWSQTLVLVFFAAISQFIAYRSVFAAITAFTVVLSLMCFPHPPLYLWRSLQKFNWVVLVAKLLFQLPPFCFDGSIHFDGCAGKSIPMYSWETVLGLVKVKPEKARIAGPPGPSVFTGPAFTSLGELLWADVLVIIALSVHVGVCSLGGRISDPRSICQELMVSDHEEKGSTSNGRSSENARSSKTRESRMTSPSSTPGPDDGLAEDDAAEDGGLTHLTSGSFGSESEGGMTVEALEDQVHDALKDFVVGHSTLRKPTMNLYMVRLPLAILCVLIVLLLWSSITGSGRSFQESLTSNSFSGPQAFAVIGAIVVIALDRGLCTWYTQGGGQATQESSTRSSLGPKGASIPRFQSERGIASTSTNADGCWNLPHKVKVTILQKFLLCLQLFILHLCLIMHLALSDTVTDIGLWKSPGQLLLYICYMGYLALTSLQLRYDVNVVRGGLALTHSTELGHLIAYRVYSLVPFMEEFRVLIDWTTTNTSMNLFMWFKLEDAHQSLYKTSCDMEGRRMLPEAAPRPLWEKCLYGFLFIVILILLIVGPILFFSTANFLLEPNTLIAGQWTASLEIRNTAAETETALAAKLQLYSASQTSIVSWSGPSLTKSTTYDEKMTVTANQVGNITFPSSSDSFWEVSPARVQQVLSVLTSNSSSPAVTCRLAFNLQTESSKGMPVSSYLEQQQPLSKRAIDSLTQVLEYLNGDPKEGPHENFTLGVKFASAIFIDSSRTASFMDRPTFKLRAHLDFDKTSKERSSWAMPFWTLYSYTGDKVSADDPDESIGFVVATEKVVPSVASSSSSASWSVVGLYLGVVYTIGRFLRIAFQDGSKRMIYEELPDTRILQDLCNGIYIARIQGNIREEWELYKALVQIYRSPQLLIDLTKPQDKGALHTLHSSVDSGAPDAVPTSRSTLQGTHTHSGLRSRRAVVGDRAS